MTPTMNVPSRHPPLVAAGMILLHLLLDIDGNGIMALVIPTTTLTIPSTPTSSHIVGIRSSRRNRDAFPPRRRRPAPHYCDDNVHLFSCLAKSSSSSLFSSPRNDDDDDDDDDDDVPSSSSMGGNGGGIYAAVHRKEHEMRRLNLQHSSLSDPIRMAMSYSQDGIEKKRLGAALRRVYDERRKSHEEMERADKMLDAGIVESSMRRGSFIVDIKRRSEMSHPGEIFARYDDAGDVAGAMARLGADVVFVNVDYHSYGGDVSELRSAVRAVRSINDRVAVVMKDVVVDEIQLGLAKEAGADGIVLCASVLGPALENFLNLATIIGLETIVECHTYNEVRAALDSLAQNIMVNNRDRITGKLVLDQAIKLAGMFPGSGGPIITIAGGGLSNTDQMKRLLAVGYDGVVVGKACMGSTMAPEYIRAVRDRTLLPAEFSQWGLDGYEFDLDGNVMNGPRDGVSGPNDADVFL